LQFVIVSRAQRIPCTQKKEYFFKKSSSVVVLLVQEGKETGKWEGGGAVCTRRLTESKGLFCEISHGFATIPLHDYAERQRSTRSYKKWVEAVLSEHADANLTPLCLQTDDGKPSWLSRNRLR
jgi:hypothetical protein